jgi:hypothetical protein
MMLPKRGDVSTVKTAGGELVTDPTLFVTMTV